MDTLFKTRCTKGYLVVYKDKVSIEMHVLGVHNENVLNLAQITGVELKTTIVSVLGMGGAVTITVHGTGNQKLEANMVKPKEAQEAKEIINNLISNKNSSKQPNSGVDQLEKLAELKNKGIITQEEFEKKKKQLLNI